jgi:cytochrome c5
MRKMSILMATAAMLVAGCGDKDQAPSPGPVGQAVQQTADVPGQAPAGAAAQPDLVQGKQIYSKNCFACHGSGAAGAPKLGDSENWIPRIAQGMDTLTDHAIKGFKGAAGYMPPKGGFISLSDSDVTAAVAYMVSESS